MLTECGVIWGEATLPTTWTKILFLNGHVSIDIATLYKLVAKLEGRV